MWSKNVLLPLLAGLVTCMPALNAKEQQSQQAKAQHFVENKGQITDQYRQARQDLDFKVAAGNGLNLFIGKGRLEYQWAKALKQQEGKDTTIEAYQMQRMEVQLIGANPKARVLTEGRQGYFERYLLSWVNAGNHNAGVLAPAYHKITYKNIYPHIDWVFYFNTKGQLEHDFVVHPGGRVSDIHLQYSGTDRLALNPDGSLTATTVMGAVTEQAPIAYNTDTKASVVSSFVLHDNQMLSFDVGPYSGTLTIDPVLEWGIYFGGPGNDECFALTTDKWGAVYMAGSTGSVTNIATTGAFQTIYGQGTTDAFVSKWNKEGQLLWATYLGGTNVDAAKGVACDTAGNVYIGGHSNSKAGIATVNAFQDTLHGGNTDAFIVKLDSSGKRVWGTYFGGINNEAQTSFGLAADLANHVYITGNTQSLNLPVTPGVHQFTLSAGFEVFVAKFNTEGQLDWSTFYGGPGTDHACGIAVDKTLKVYITGYTQSMTGIATTGAYQGSIGGGADAYLAQFNPSGQLNWATYIGGSATERGYALSVFDNEKIVIGGVTNSTAGMAVNNAHQNTKNMGDDCFIALFDHKGQLEWSTYYGGDGSDALTGICIDSKSIYALGETDSKDKIATIPALREDLAGATDAFIAKFNLKGERIWGTYYGGTSSESAKAITLTPDFNIYIGGKSNSGTGIATPNAAFPNLSGGYDAILVRINDCEPPPPLSSITGDTLLCSGDTTGYSIEPDSIVSSYQWLLPAQWIGVSDHNQIRITAGEVNGILQVYALSACGGISDTQSIHITAIPLPEPEIQNHNGILSTTKAYPTYQWLWNNTVIEGATEATYIATKNGQYSVKVTNTEGCEGISDGIELAGLSIEPALADQQFQIYPNPVAEIMVLDSREEGMVQIFHIDGKAAGEPMRIYKGPNSIAMSGVPAGMYLLRVHTSKSWQYLKLIKK